jgi:uncharacterized delta-60 repeat protein
MRAGFIAVAASSGSGPGAPGAVRNLVATPGSELVNLSWTAPVSNGGSAITDHQFQAAPSAFGAGGTRDTTFTTNTGTAFNDGFVDAIAIQSDGKIVAVGSFTSFNNVTVNRIARLNTNGTSDTTFTTNTGTAFNNFVDAIAIQSDGKIVLGGEFTSFNGAPTNRIVRLNPNGTRDTDFSANVGAAFNNSSDLILSIAIQSDGKIVIGGYFTGFNGAPVNRIVRLNSDGTRDTAFSANVGAGFNSIADSVEAIAVQSDGKIVIGGEFTAFNGAPVSRIVRLNTDGTRDTTFTTNTGTAFNNFVNAIAIQSDGKIVLGGEFTSFNGVTVNRIVRLNSDGTRDATFTTNTGTAFNGTVSSVAIQSDGQIVASGGFTSFNSVAATYIVRLNADGARDATFTTNEGAFNSNVRSVAIQSDGKIVAAGNFTVFDGTTVNRIVRLNSGAVWSNISSSGSSGTSYTFTGLTSSVEYVLRARAVNAIGASPWVETATPVTPNVAAVVTGGTLTSDSTYYYRTFTSSGTLGISAAPLSLDYVMCSGGEGGNGYNAPELSTNTRFTATGGRGSLVTTGSALGSLGSFAVVVGGGGSGGVRSSNNGATASGTYGSASSISTIAASTAENTTYTDGGTATTRNCLSQPRDVGLSGGGAGSSANGGNPSFVDNGNGTGSAIGGTGGAGTSVWGQTYGGGGGAASWNVCGMSAEFTGVAGAGGSGGGGTGGVNSTNPAAGSANTGGGGGGGVNVTNALGGAGGSGIVIVRYLKSAVGG